LAPTHADFLQTVTSAYELLEPEERREATLRIGGGPRLSYAKAFRRIENYFEAAGPPIFHGGVRVQLHGPNFAVRFFDRILRRSEVGTNEGFEASLYLKRQLLQKHWNGRFLMAQLSAALEPGHYAHGYFFGALVPHPRHAGRLLVHVASLEHLAFTVRTLKRE
jgi:hypothetical protein